MSPRTLVAGARAEPSGRVTSSQFQEDCEAMLFGALADLWLLAKRRQPLIAAKDQLDFWLTKAYFSTVNSPDHADIKQRRQRVDAAESRLCGLRGELNRLEGEAEALRRTAGKHFDRLRAPRRLELLASNQWPADTTGTEVAERMWQEAQQERGTWMAGEPPW